MGKPRKRIRSKKARSCTGKQAFDTLEKAEAAARRPWASLKTGTFMTAYRCRFCRQHHYGHPPK